MNGWNYGDSTEQIRSSLKVEQLGARTATATYIDLPLGKIHRNDYGFWVSTVFETRYYSNPRAVAFEMLQAHWQKNKKKPISEFAKFNKNRKDY